MTISAIRNEPFTHELNIAELAAEGMYREVILTPKPGLVDRHNNGSHIDMDFNLFMSSIAAIAPWFALFVAKGRQTAKQEPRQTLLAIRPVGLACEQAMFRATGGINTHKGGIFSLGLFCSAAGRLKGKGEAINRRALCREVSLICAGMVSRELKHNGDAKTKGEQLFRDYGFTGARGEAESGFATVRIHGLPVWENAINAGYSPEESLLRVLLSLMAHNPDTNILARGGLKGLRYAQRYAARILRIKHFTGNRFRQALLNMDKAFIARNLSPGGSADLLAVTWLLANFPA
ncbi:triphosphoribosyl-dephospho-CoA synthase CitG [Kosakonia radicincitans]|uniref:triphosphoribosyl-dephospho-CoA synthase CitG n=1 Tax=Kosakonia radicincitans TaxID=283686 RepID=UPI0031DEB8B3